MSQPPLIISMGDPCGIGPDIILAAWHNRKAFDLPGFWVAGDRSIFERRARILGLDVPVGEVGSQIPIFEKELPIVPVASSAKGDPGNPELEDARLAMQAIEVACDKVFYGQASALVTAPINKEALQKAGFVHPGHTEYLAQLADDHYGNHHHPVMMLAGPELRTIPVTIHIPLNKVPKVLSSDLISRTIRIAAHDLSSRFAIPSPRIVVAGLNPHAGENGTIGSEDQEVVAPAIKALAREGVDVSGPYPADTLFHVSARQRYDVAICMYHDQALIPAKTLGFDDAVNVTLGLPFIRTSPDHGTAYDIVGTGKANPASFVAAIRMAAEMVQHS